MKTWLIAIVIFAVVFAYLVYTGKVPILSGALPDVFESGGGSQ